MPRPPLIGLYLVGKRSQRGCSNEVDGLQSVFGEGISDELPRERARMK